MTDRFDKAPEMVTITYGDFSLSMPKATMETYDDEEKKRVALAIARVTMFYAGRHDTPYFEDDLATVLGVDGVLMTVPGFEEPLTAREFFGGVLLTGSVSDIDRFRPGSEPE